MQVAKIHLHSIRTLSEAVKRFDKAHKAFMSNPNGDEYKEMETSREDMFLVNDIIFQTNFPDETNIDIKDAMRIAKEIKILKSTPVDPNNVI